MYAGSVCTAQYLKTALNGSPYLLFGDVVVLGQALGEVGFGGSHLLEEAIGAEHQSDDPPPVIDIAARGHGALLL